MTTPAPEASVPRAGMLATVRNRRGVVAAVEPFDGEAGRLHLVHLEYKDDHAPSEERLLWELEPSRHLLEPNALPDPARGGAMPAGDFDALLRAARWTALSPYLDPRDPGVPGGAGSGDRGHRGDSGGEAGPDDPPYREPVASPFHGGVRIESYQLVPLLKALRMPRVSLLIADDVGLGKTVEAGLILTELLLRRRIRRILVLTPASLRRQWCEELWDKFSLRFEMVDRLETERLRRRLGMDANPWRSFGRIVASFHYLRQPDVLEQFLSACRTPEGSPHLPWDLLIVDECHHLMPSPFGEDSGLCRMLRLVAPQFEHRLFLSATPHNGHTRSFTGLLEMLDPVRFTRTGEMSPAMRGRVEDVVIRRLKRDIDAGSLQRERAAAGGLPQESGSRSRQAAESLPQERTPRPGQAAESLSQERTPRPGQAAGSFPHESGPRPGDARGSAPQEPAAPAPRFCTRHPPQALILHSGPREAALSAAFDAFRSAVRALVSEGTKPRRRAGTFAVEILGKRLLSCPTAFAESWSRARQGFSEQDGAVEKAVTGTVGIGTAGAATVEAETLVEPEPVIGADRAGATVAGAVRAETVKVEAAADTAVAEKAVSEMVSADTVVTGTTVAGTALAETELAAAERALRQETGDDREAQQREATAATVVGAWLKHFVDDVEEEIRGIERALDSLGFALDPGGAPITDQTPAADARFDALVALIERLLCEGPWRHAGGTDTGGAGTGGTDAGSAIAESTGIGGADTGDTDAGDTDAGGTDAGSTDTGSTDTGGTDTGGTDAGSTDAGSAIAESTGIGGADTRDTGAGSPDTRRAGAQGTVNTDGFRGDERLIVFTEYKTTLDYLARRLRERYCAGRVLTLFGAGGPEGMDETGRENVKAAFNDPASPVRILVATDAASEGLNLHRTARYLLHYDCPWNPSKLEQRNGRLDRYGQARDVTVHHFMSHTDPDLRFLDHVIRKADEIREDLGSVNEVFDRAAHRRLIRGEDTASVQDDLDRGIEAARGNTLLEADARVTAAMPAGAETAAKGTAGTAPERATEGAAPEGTPERTAKGTAPEVGRQSRRDHARRYVPEGAPEGASEGTAEEAAETAAAGGSALVDAMAAELDHDERALYDTLDTAMAIPSAGRPQLRQIAEDPGFYRVLRPDLPGWRDVIDEALRRPVPGGGQGPMPRLAFSTEPFIEQLGYLRVFLPRADAVLMHLAHPMMQRALGVLARRRYPGAGGEVSRWTVRRGGVPDEAEAIVLLSIEELGVNELRETFHRWVRTLALPVRDGILGEPLAHAPARTLRGARETHDPEDRERAGEILEDAGPGLREWLRGYKVALTERLRRRLESDGEAARRREDERYRQRQGEVSALIEQSTMARLAREIGQLAHRRRQGQLFDESERLAEIERSIEEKEEELGRRRHHYEEIREQLQRERTRILERLLPARFALAGSPQVFPVAVEVRLPERGS